jgi:hypothetical protein
MRTLIPMTLAAAFLLTLACNNPAAAQEPKGAATLQEAADKARNAILTGTPEAFVGSIAPWLQERVRLHQLERTASLEAARKENKDFAVKFAADWKARMEGDEGLDPAGLSQIKTLDDALKLTPEQALAIDFGYYRLRGLERLKDNVAGLWFVVDRVTGTEEEEGITRVTGSVRYCSAGYRDSIEVTCVQDEAGWHVVDLSARVEDVEFSLADCALTANPLDARLEEEAAVGEMRADAEDSLRAMRDYARMHWSKNQQVPKSLIKDAQVHEDALGGTWHKIRDEVYKQAGANRGAIVAEPADEQDFMGWAIITFDYDGGQSQITWYETVKELDDALDDFQTEK